MPRDAPPLYFACQRAGRQDWSSVKRPAARRTGIISGRGRSRRTPRARRTASLAAQGQRPHPHREGQGCPLRYPFALPSAVRTIRSRRLYGARTPDDFYYRDGDRDLESSGGEIRNSLQAGGIQGGIRVGGSTERASLLDKSCRVFTDPCLSSAARPKCRAPRATAAGDGPPPSTLRPSPPERITKILRFPCSRQVKPFCPVRVSRRASRARRRRQCQRSCKKSARPRMLRVSSCSRATGKP